MMEYGTVMYAQRTVKSSLVFCLDFGHDCPTEAMRVTAGEPLTILARLIVSVI